MDTDGATSMKSFEHLKRLGGLNCRRGALRHYALYRACSLGGDTSMRALEDFHRYESTGELPPAAATFTEFSKLNGYANGKWVLKLTHDQILEDLAAGVVCKAEFFSSRKLKSIFGSVSSVHEYSRSSWFWDKALDGARASELFAYRG